MIPKTQGKIKICSTKFGQSIKGNQNTISKF